MRDTKRPCTKNDEFEIRFFEGVVHRSPEFIQALMALGDLYTKCGYYKRGLNIDQKLVRLRPHDPVVFYNLACSFSLLHEPDKAFRALKLAIRKGYHEFDFMAKDKDLENLRHYGPFKVFLEGLKKELERRGAHEKL